MIKKCSDLFNLAWFCNNLWLREMDIPFIDTAGNAYINQPPLYIFIKGDKLAEEPRPEQIQRAFRPVGLQALYVLLCNPGIEDKALREIAKAADVALGTVNRVMKELERMGYLVKMGRRGRRLVRKDTIEWPEFEGIEMITLGFKESFDNSIVSFGFEICPNGTMSTGKLPL